MRHICFSACSAILLHLATLSIAKQRGCFYRYKELKPVGGPFSDQDKPVDEEPALQWSELDQKLDHFSPDSIETWKQRYSVNMTSYDGKERVFLNIEGEWEALNNTLGNGTIMARFAEKLGAAKFSLEHRFYGNSRPKPDLTVESLKYLSSQQALADLAYFITKMNKKFGFSDPKWIVFGCSYAGSLAAWLRYKYPNLVYAAVSSSAPLLAKVNFPEYAERVAESLALTGGQQCVDAIKSANIEMSEAMSNSTKRKEFQDLFRLCEPLENNEKDISRFFGLQADDILGAVKTNIYRANENSTDVNNQVICDVMNNETIGDPVRRYAELNKLFLRSNKAECWNHTYSKWIGELKDTSYHVSTCACIANQTETERQWAYQSCTEFGYFTPSSGINDTFGYSEPLKLFIDACSDMFDSRFNESLLNQGIEANNIFYGALSLAVTRVVFVHGSQDPWSAVGITSNPPEGSYAIYINGTSHCQDVYLEDGESSQPQLKEARLKVLRILEKWVSGENQPEDSNFV